MINNALWLPAHPAEGSFSMDRYWREIDFEFKGHPDSQDLSISSPLGKPPVHSQRESRLRRAWNKYIAYPNLVRGQKQTDVVHVLDHSYAYLLKYVSKAAYKIVTVHDIAPLRDPRELSRSQLARFKGNLMNLHSADLLIAVSEFTAGDTVDFLGIDRKKIVVLPMGVNVEAVSRRAEPLPVLKSLRPRKFILSVGSLLPRKNLCILPEILSEVKKTIPNIALVRVGSLFPDDFRAKLHAILSPEDVLELGAIPDTTLASVYQSAHVLVFPSSLEGFGMPVAEAMAAGCPVVSSNASSLPEVGGDAALYFSPSSPREAAERINEMLSNEQLRMTLVERGRKRAEHLSWGAHVKGLIEFYKQASAGR